MKWSWRWLIGDYVPVESGLPYAERKRLLEPIFRTMIGARTPAIFGGVSGVAFAAIMVLGRRNIPLPLVFVGIVLFALFLNFAMGFFIAGRIGTSIFRALRARDIDLCPRCLYDLRDSPVDSTVCPECGRRRSFSPPQVRSTEDHGP